MTDQPTQTERSYGCTFGCGNPYDFVFISVQDGTTEFLCVPCFVKLASDIVSAVLDPDPKLAAVWLAAGANLDQAPMRQRSARARGHNAPTTTDDPELFSAFESVITADELGDEFR